jgi:hypothetical protein
VLFWDLNIIFASKPCFQNFAFFNVSFAPGPMGLQGRDDGRRDRDRGKARSEAIVWDANWFPVLEQVLLVHIIYNYIII